MHLNTRGSAFSFIFFKGGSGLIEAWLRNKNTIEFLGVWEKLNNPSFNSLEFEGIKTQAGLNRFSMSAKSWMDKVNGIGVIAKAGRYGGTFAHTRWKPKRPCNLEQLVVLASLEIQNALLIEQGVDKTKRIELLSDLAKRQMQSLLTNPSVKKLSDKPLLEN